MIHLKIYNARTGIFQVWPMKNFTNGTYKLVLGILSVRSLMLYILLSLNPSLLASTWCSRYLNSHKIVQFSCLFRLNHISARKPYIGVRDGGGGQGALCPPKFQCKNSGKNRALVCFDLFLCFLLTCQNMLSGILGAYIPLCLYWNRRQNFGAQKTILRFG